MSARDVELRKIWTLGIFGRTLDDNSSDDLSIGHGDKTDAGIHTLSRDFDRLIHCCVIQPHLGKPRVCSVKQTRQFL